MNKFVFLILTSMSIFAANSCTELICVTSGKHKWELFQQLGKGHFELIKNELPLSEIQEKPDTIAIHKAEQAFQQLHQPLIVDDSGFYLDAYPDFPAGGTDMVMKAIGIDGLMKFCESVGNFRLTVYSIIVYLDDTGSRGLFKGETSGILQKPLYFLEGLPKRPEPWFDYFIPDGSKKTYGQLFDDGELEAFYYRAKAFKNFLEWFKKNRK